MEATIQTTGLSRRFGALEAVDRLDLVVPAGCFYGFLGPNGAGKSTTIKMLTGMLSPTRGRTRIFGLDLEQRPLEVKRRIGVVPEDLPLFDNLTGREYLTFIGRMHGLDRDTLRRRTDELLELVDLDDHEGKLALEYSHGMKKKLALAAALIHDPGLLFLDEPFEGIDAVASRILRDILKRYVARGSTIFLTSHVLDIVEKLCTHVGVIHQGRMVVQGSMGEIRAGGSLEERFIEIVGADTEARRSVEWLES
jgi:ABC-2 type transport system ATP-binding protein